MPTSLTNVDVHLAKRSSPTWGTALPHGIDASIVNVFLPHAHDVSRYVFGATLVVVSLTVAPDANTLCGEATLALSSLPLLRCHMYTIGIMKR